MSKTRQVFVPQPVEDDREPIPQLNQLIANPSQRLMVMRKVQRAQELKDQIEPLEKERDKVKADLKDLLGQHKIDKCMVDDLRVSYYGSPGRKTLDKALLLENHVSPETLEKCTVVGKPIFTLKITRVGDDVEA